MDSLSPVIVALDVPERSRALELVEETADYVDIYKVGPILFLRYGPSIVEEIASRGKSVFLDVKFHDIPNTVRGAVTSAASMGAYMVTVHLAGGRRMLEAALEGKVDGLPLVLGVSVLTSMGDGDLREVGVRDCVKEQVRRLVGLGAQAGIDGVVCSFHELSVVEEVAPHLIRVVPGVRPHGASPGDQKRVATPQEALERGAHFVVLGRPVYSSDNPRGVVKSIVEALDCIYKKNLFNRQGASIRNHGEVEVEERIYEEMAEYIKALAHPTRLKILEYLMKEKMTCVKFLWEELGLQQSNVSQHLAILKQRGIIDSRKEGVKTCYWIKDENAVKLFHFVKSVVTEALDKEQEQG